jgi:hypothetical protein
MKTKTIWIVLNYKRIFCMGITKRAAVEEAERACGKPWGMMHKYMRVAKFEINEVPNASS